MLGRGQTPNVPPASGTVIPAHHLLLGTGVPRRGVPRVTPLPQLSGWAWELRGERMGGHSPHRRHLGESSTPRTWLRLGGTGGRRAGPPRIRGQRVGMRGAFVPGNRWRFCPSVPGLWDGALEGETPTEVLPVLSSRRRPLASLLHSRVPETRGERIPAPPVLVPALWLCTPRARTQQHLPAASGDVCPSVRPSVSRGCAAAGGKDGLW